MTVEIRTGPQPGLIGEIAAHHGRYYVEHWNFGTYFEARVAGGCADFMQRAVGSDLILSAWSGTRFAGSLIVDLNDPEAPGLAHLRWFFVATPGEGLGREMMKRAMAHVDRYRRACFLTTFRGLDVARRLYEDFGFTLTDEAEAETWGTRVFEQRFDRPASR